MFEPFGKIRVDIMRRLIVSCQPEDKVIVDLGAGNPAVSDNIKCKKQIKIDIDPTTKPDIVCDLTKGIPLPENSADIVVASEILEHIYNSKKFVSEIRRVLTNNGHLILSCPNICSLKYRIAFLIGKIPAHAAKADMSYEDDRPGHIRDYNFKEVKELLTMFNFKIIKSYTDGIHYKSKLIVPRYFIKKTFGDSIIINY